MSSCILAPLAYSLGLAKERFKYDAQTSFFRCSSNSALGCRALFITVLPCSFARLCELKAFVLEHFRFGTISNATVLLHIKF